MILIKINFYFPDYSGTIDRDGEEQNFVEQKTLLVIIFGKKYIPFSS